MKKITVLVLDDEKEIREELSDYFSSRSFTVVEAATPSEANKVLSVKPIDIALIDIRLPEMDGLEFFQEMKRSYPSTTTIMMSGHGDMDSVIKALRLGAFDYFKKPFKMQDMIASIDKAIKFILYKQVDDIEHDELNLHKSTDKSDSSALFAIDPVMKEVIKKINLVARAKDTTVLITGETGVGKELIARAIHLQSERKNMTFHAINCSSIPDELFESEFFGYNKGAFTGATMDKIGWFEAANGGTLFLDEIGDLKMSLQAKLLRIMDDRMINRLGSTSFRKVDVRVIAATNQDLEELIQRNQFRRDLFHRLNTFVIQIPPLRERKESIPLLFKFFLKHYAQKLGRKIPKVNPDLMNALEKYDFPGNVRELKHMIERALILCEDDCLSFEHFDHIKIKLQHSVMENNTKCAQTLGSLEKATIEAAMAEAGNNKSKVARALGLSRQSLDRKIKKLGINTAQ